MPWQNRDWEVSLGVVTNRHQVFEGSVYSVVRWVPVPRDTNIRRFSPEQFTNFLSPSPASGPVPDERTVQGWIRSNDEQSGNHNHPSRHQDNIRASRILERGANRPNGTQVHPDGIHSFDDNPALGTPSPTGVAEFELNFDLFDYDFGFNLDI